MIKMKNRITVLVLTVFLFGVNTSALAKKSVKKTPPFEELQALLLMRAETYAKYYQNRKFKDIYDLVNVKYRLRVSRAMYEDYITFPDETDKYFLVTVEMCDVMGDDTLGKVIFKISTYGKDHVKGRATAEDESVGELESEFMEATDWVYESGDWYKVERYDK